ncbi:MAG: HEAT repeat domain-containing protein [Syntrophobacterales bacterium]
MLGLLIAQVIATIQVYLSNLDLYRSLSAIQAAGFLTIPNQRTMSSLQDFGPAFLGGLFFTFSLGAGLSLLSLAAAWVWHRLFSRSRPVLIVLLLFWMGSVVVLNVRGFSIGATCYFLAIPPVVFLATLRWIPPLSGQRVWVRGVVHTIPVAVLALLWTSQLDGHLFVDFRDLVLLSNPVGTKINDFYYDYTLFPAEVFKSLEQKLLKTCSLRNFEKGSLLARVEKELLSYDYLNVGTNDAVDLIVLQDDNMLVFNHGKRTIHQTTPADFLAHPGAALHELSAKTDKNGFFRQLTFRSLVIGLPLALYLLLHALIRFVCCFFLDVRTSSIIASVLCLIVGLSILIPFLYMRGASFEFDNVPQALASESWQERVAALRIIEQKGLEVSSFQHYPQLLTNPRIAVRYWLVRGLAVSRRPETYRDLLAFLDDPHPNVVSMAFYGLGQRGDWRAVSEILTRIKTSDHWYNQWYAYKALRTLGWKQKKSQ